MGYRRLRQPLLLTNSSGKKTRNPFEAGEEGETIWCKTCKDMLYDSGDPPCEHLDWCAECAAWMYVADGELQDSYGPGKCEHNAEERDA